MKYVLVTGACGGMGSATVNALLSSGYGVIALDRVVGEDRNNVRYIECDVTSEESVCAAAEAAKAFTDELYGIVHYAGTYMLDSLVEMNGADYERIFKINTFGAFYVNKAFLSMLRPGSRIVITTSELAPLDPLPFTGVYAVTKAALDKYAYSLRMELQLLDITVSVLRAGAVSTGMLGVSTAALDRFCEGTKLYKFSANRFKDIVASVEARNVSTERLAKKMLAILGKKKPAFKYAINRNPLLILLNALPKRLQLFIIKKILK